MFPSRTAALVGVFVVGLAVPIAIGSVAAADVTLTVTVVDYRGEPVSGVDVTASWDGDSVTEQTRASGQALLDVPAGAEVELDVSGASYMRNHPYVIENATTREARVSVGEAGQARVTVTDDDGPVAGATVRLEAIGRTAGSVETGADGVAQIEPVERKTYTLRVSKPGYFDHSERLRIDDVATQEVQLEEAIVGLDVMVQDPHFDPPEEIEEATVEISPSDVRLVTLGNGEASTRLSANRDYELSVNKSGYRPVTRDLSAGESDVNATVNMSRTPAVDLQVAQEAVVLGQTTQVTVTDEYGDPVTDAPITLDGDEAARTDEGGQATVSIDTAGDVAIGVSHEGATDTVTIEGVRGDSGTSGGDNGTDDGNQSTDGGIGPGFGPGSALVALLALVGVSLGLARRS